MRKKRVLINSLVMGAVLYGVNTDCCQRGMFAQSVKRSSARVRVTAASARREVYPTRTKAQIDFAAISARARMYEPYMLQSARKYGVDPRALWAIAFMETKFRPYLVSEKGARGMMQFIPATAARFRLADPFNPVASIEAAARYVRFLSGRFAGHPALVIAAYNAGEGAVDSYLRGIPLRLKDGKVINPRGLRTGGVPPYAETERYVAGGLSVMRLVNDLEVFSATEIAACGARVALPRPPRSTAQRALASGGVALGSSPESGAERVVESAPEPVSIYARVMNQPVSARLPSPAPASEISISRTAVPVDDASEGAACLTYRIQAMRLGASGGEAPLKYSADFAPHARRIFYHPRGGKSAASITTAFNKKLSSSEAFTSHLAALACQSFAPFLSVLALKKREPFFGHERESLPPASV